MSTKRNVSILAEQHHHHHHPPPPPHPHAHPTYQSSSYTTGPSVLSPVSAASAGTAAHHQAPQNLPALSTLSTLSYPPPPPPPSILHTSSSQPRADVQEKFEHGYSGPHSGRGTPIVRNHVEGPFQRTPSTPLPPQGHGPPPPAAPPPPLHPPQQQQQQQQQQHQQQQQQQHLQQQQQQQQQNDRPPMDNGHVAQPLYAAPPSHPEAHHMMYAPQHHPGPPMMEPGTFVAHPGYAPQGYLYPNMHMANNANTRKKSMRASQACDKCRERKSKCDEQRPCSTCKEQNIECHYKDSQPSKVDRSNAQLSETLQAVAEQMKCLTDRIAGLEDVIGRDSTLKTEKMSRQTSRNDTPAPLVDSDETSLQSLSDVRRPSLDENYDFAEHTTAAHKLLLRWPSINKLFKGRRPDRTENYPLKVEDRGCLRLYGRGERVLDDSVFIGAASPASTGSDEFSAPSPEMNTSCAYDEPKRSDPRHVSRLDMDSMTLHRLFEKYKKHIHRLHPFLDIDQFGKYIKRFISSHCSDATRFPLSPHTMFVANGGNDSQRAGMKRKRSEALGAGSGPNSFSSSESNAKRRAVQPPDRTIVNAIVYFVFALGKICEAKVIRGPLVDDSQLANTTDHAQPGASPMVLKPSPCSPHSIPVGFTPPAGDGFAGRASSHGDSPGVEKRHATNIDAIPGLDYYREAVSILGDFADANDLASAQARLLAALYKGQLCRVQESWSWLHLASRTCQYRMRLEGLNITYDPRMVFDKTKNLTLLAFWTCLQLESDILAELDYPHSGLSAMEGTVNWPNNVLDEEAVKHKDSSQGKYTDLDMINFYYSAQLFLRKHLNQIHTRLYSVDLAKQDPKVLSDTLNDLDRTLQGWRDLPHPVTFWNDSEEPHPDIVAARLRAKYYGARYVTTRPFLDYALHVMDRVANGERLENVTVDAKGNSRPQEIALFKAIEMMPLETIQHKVRVCVDSAMKSTVALDGVNDHRLIVTNIMGTAHAQFGNVLVLAATAKSPLFWLRDLVPMPALSYYITRTIDFLEKLKAASATASVDLQILQELKSNLDLDTVHSDYQMGGTSFMN